MYLSLVRIVCTTFITFTFSHLADAFIQSDLQLGVHKQAIQEQQQIISLCLLIETDCLSHNK